MIENVKVEGDKSTSLPKKRCDYVDLVKGFCIIWVVWFHALHPEFVGVPYRMPLFFFVSGFFMKNTNIIDYIYRRFRQLIVPFVFFFLLYYPLWMITYLWDNRTLNGFDWGAIHYMFNISSEEFVAWNGPLWFLLVLFIINVCVFIIHKTRYDKLVYVVLILLSFFFFDNLKDRPWLEYVVYIGYYTWGILVGKKMMNLLSKNLVRFFILIIFVALYVVLSFLSVRLGTSVLHGLIYTVSVACFSIAVVALFSYFDSSKIMFIFRFFGKNSLIVLGLHWWLTTAFFSRIFKVIFDYNPPVWTGFVNVILTLIVIALVTPLINKYCKFFMGKNVKGLTFKKWKA